MQPTTAPTPTTAPLFSKDILQNNFYLFLLVQGNDLARNTHQFETNINYITRTAQSRKPLLYSRVSDDHESGPDGVLRAQAEGHHEGSSPSHTVARLARLSIAASSGSVARSLSPLMR